LEAKEVKTKKERRKIRGWFPQEPNARRMANLKLDCNTVQQTFLPVVGGTLTIIGSFIVFLVSNFQLIPFGGYVISLLTSVSFNVPNVFMIFGFGCLNTLCFATALKSGSLAIQRKHYKFSITGPILLLAAILFTTILDLLTVPFPLTPTVNFAVPLATLSILSLVLIGLSRKEFEPYKNNVGDHGNDP
jgi:hypothetical protein